MQMSTWEGGGRGGGLEQHKILAHAHERSTDILSFWVFRHICVCKLNAKLHLLVYLEYTDIYTCTKMYMDSIIQMREVHQEENPDVERIAESHSTVNAVYRK